MLAPYGRHRGRTTRQLALQYPADAVAMLREDDGSFIMRDFCAEIRKQILAFDGAPFVKSCEGRDCEETATRLTVYGRNLNPRYWCDECDPLSAGAYPGDIQQVATYEDAVRHVYEWCGGLKGDLKYLIGIMARAKGLWLGGNERSPGWAW